MIPFNQPFLSGKETSYIIDAVNSKKISGNGKYTQLCHQFFREKFNFNKCLLTSSCTDALEMSAILADIKPGDEVIMPSFTFVSTANAFVLRGAKIIFADSMINHPNMDISQLESLITKNTKAIVPVHYAGVACDMDPLLEIAKKNNIVVIEDAAQAIDSYYKNKPLGSIGDMSAFSFHETKNIISGEGGMLVTTNEKYHQRAEIIWEKGTNRASFFRGEVDKYGWVDIGSSFLPSEIVAAFLYAQLENIKEIQNQRKNIWDNYYNGLKDLSSEFIKLPFLPEYASNNAHMFYIQLENGEVRQALINELKKQDIHCVFHYQSLHKSPFYENKHDGRALPHSDHFTETLLRLPFYYELNESDQNKVINGINKFFGR
jgi:dTDP-4-amino-4,6-dideoxygalactose transaminase